MMMEELLQDWIKTMIMKLNQSVCIKILTQQRHKQIYFKLDKDAIWSVGPSKE